MQFKRWRLVAARPLVNWSFSLALLFAAAACSGPENKGESDTQTAETSPMTASDIELPVLWATSPLEGAVQDVAVSSGIGGILAVAYERAGLQLFTMEGDRITEPANLYVTALARGMEASIDGASLTIFPGIDGEGRLKAYLFGNNLPAPLGVDLPVEEPRKVMGLCAAQNLIDEGALFDLAYWTSDNNRALKRGRIGVSGEDFTWITTSAVTHATAIQSCEIVDGAALPSSDTLVATLSRNGSFATVSASAPAGSVAVNNQRIDLRDGITVSAPDEVTAIDGVGTALSGGYPNGVLILAGPYPDGAVRAAFIDPGPLFTAGE